MIIMVMIIIIMIIIITIIIIIIIIIISVFIKIFEANVCVCNKKFNIQKYNGI